LNKLKRRELGGVRGVRRGGREEKAVLFPPPKVIRGPRISQPILANIEVELKQE